MDQNQSIDNDLQKAIDNITNTTNVDPVFSDPVAAPSSIPEGDTGELGEPIGPFPEPKLEMIPPTPEPIAPLNAMSDIPNLAMPDNSISAPTTESTPEPAPAAAESTTEPLNMNQVKIAALRDLVPILDKININKSEKFRIYRDIFEELKDYTVLEPAYRAAHDIEDDTERAQALLYLVEAIDKI